MSQSLRAVIALNLEELRFPDDYNFVAQQDNGDIYVFVDSPLFDLESPSKLQDHCGKQVNKIKLPVASNQEGAYLSRQTVEEIMGASFVGVDNEIYLSASPDVMTYRLNTCWNGGYTWEPVEDSMVPKSMQLLERSL